MRHCLDPFVWPDVLDILFFCEIIFFWKIIIHVLTGKFQYIPFLGQLTVREAIYMHPWPSASNVLLLFSSQSNILDTWYMRVTWYNIYIYLMFDTVLPGVFYPNFSHLYSLDSQHLWFGDDMLEPFWQQVMCSTLRTIISNFWGTQHIWIFSKPIFQKKYIHSIM